MRTEAPAERCMRSLMLMISVLVCCPTATIGAQNQTATVRIQVRAAEKPVEDAEVVVAGTTHRTDAAGTTTISHRPRHSRHHGAEIGFRSDDRIGAGGSRRHSRRGGGVTGTTYRRGDRHGRGVYSHRQEARGSAHAGRSPGSRRDRGEDAHDARGHRHDAERNGRDAGAGDVAVARGRECPHSGHARPVYTRALRRIAAVW